MGLCKDCEKYVEDFVVKLDLVESKYRWIHCHHGEEKKVESRGCWVCMNNIYKVHWAHADSDGRIGITLRAAFCPNCGKKIND